MKNDDEAKNDGAKPKLISPKAEREIAFYRLREVLDQKQHGDRITAEEIINVTGFTDWREFAPQVRRYFKQRGLPLFYVTNDGWRIGQPI